MHYFFCFAVLAELIDFSWIYFCWRKVSWGCSCKSCGGYFTVFLHFPFLSRNIIYIFLIHSQANVFASLLYHSAVMMTSWHWSMIKPNKLTVSSWTHIVYIYSWSQEDDFHWLWWSPDLSSSSTMTFILVKSLYKSTDCDDIWLRYSCPYKRTWSFSRTITASKDQFMSQNISSHIFRQSRSLLNISLWLKKPVLYLTGVTMSPFTLPINSDCSCHELLVLSKFLWYIILTN